MVHNNQIVLVDANIGYMGNHAVSSFSVPAEAADYVMKQNPFAGGK